MVIPTVLINRRLRAFPLVLAGGTDDEEATLVTDHQTRIVQLPAPTISQTLEYNPGMMLKPVMMPSGDTLYPGETTVMPQQVFFLPGTDSTAAPNSGELMAPCASTSSCGIGAGNQSTLALRC